MHNNDGGEKMDAPLCVLNEFHFESGSVTATCNMDSVFPN